MIDTVKFDIPLILTEAQINHISWTEVRTTLRRRMVRCELFTKDDDTQPRIVYSYKEDNPERSWLKLELSLPRYLHGSNVYEVKQREVEPALKKLRRFIAKSFGVTLSQVPCYDKWEIEKLHVCKNFRVGNQLQSYMNFLSRTQKAGGYKTVPYYAANGMYLESVVFQRNTKKNRSIHKFYDKRAETRQKSPHPDKLRHLQEAEGILRYEVELSYDEMRKYSKSRNAKELLDPQIAVKVLGEGIDLLGLGKPILQTSFKAMVEEVDRSNQSTRSRSMLIAFLTEMNLYGKSYCKSRYTKTTYHHIYSKLKAILNVDEIKFSDIYLPPLKIHKNSFKDKKSRSTSIVPVKRPRKMSKKIVS
ncbi:hypothetical protein [Paenibacillus glufosinatiresistens]|uniref:hypothetical protein n=1 Tax=Paenibacillus glufosinatiresistens TaxID=3070657 RepID=UPI00286E8EC6|nr:hypothetical protein [Paenibacillus sp. YX.27]